MSEHKTNNTINIACAVDDAFSYPLAVMLVSLLENNRESSVRIHLFSASMSDSHVRRFTQLVARYDQKFEFYRLKDEAFSGLPVSNRISNAAYYRILIPENIDSQVDRYLYLDADLIVTGKLEPLFMIDMDDKVIASVNDVAAIDMDKHKKHSIPEKYLYFNSGVMLVDKNRWLQADAGKRVLRYRTENNDICDFLDQDGFNGALYKERLNIPPRWNQQVGLFYVNGDAAKKAYPDGMDEARYDPAIVHFNGSEKPWHRVSAHPYKRQFRKYARMVKEFKYSEKPGIRKLIKRHVIYRLFGWSRVNRYYYLKTRPRNDANAN